MRSVGAAGSLAVAALAATALACSSLLQAPPAAAAGSAPWAASAVAPPSELAALSPWVVSVSCPTAGSCVAIGTYRPGSGTTLGLLLTDSSGTWSASEAPLPPGAGSNPSVELAALSCASAASCVAVGTYEDASGDTQGLLLTDSSGTWSASEAPLPSAGTAANPYASPVALACASASSCVAVGTYLDSSSDEQGLLLTDSSGTWSASEAPLPPAAPANPHLQPVAVACASAASCVAVGTYEDSSGDTQGLLLTDSSGSWSTSKAPLPSGAGGTYATPSVILCPSTSSCVAAGNYDDSSGDTQILLLTDSSGTWSAAKGPLPSGVGGDPNTVVESISCPSTSSCVAVGRYQDSTGNIQGLLLADSSGSWSASKAPLPSGAASDQSANVSSLSCASTSSCAAAGDYTDTSGNIQSVLLTDSSGSWSAAKAPLPAGTASNPLAEPLGVSCPATSSCVVVGNDDDTSEHSEGLLLTDASGSWSAAEAPLPPGASPSPSVVARSITCSSSGCVAVGDYQDSTGHTQGLIVTDTSGSWSAAEAPLPSGTASNPVALVTAAACPSATSCSAVGTYSNSSSRTEGLVLTDASGSWSATAAPLPSAVASNPLVSLTGVACPSTSGCVAVGSYFDSSYDEQGLLLTKSSGAWSAAEAPLPSGAASEPTVTLGALSCASASSCVAVGSYEDSSGSSQGLVLTDSSGAWSAAEAPLPAGAGSSPSVTLGAVSCASASSCVAVGHYSDSSGDRQGLLLTKSSGTWSASEAPLPAAAAANPTVTLGGISCASASSCVAVGSYEDSSAGTEGLLLTDTSGAWSASEAALPTGAAASPSVALVATSCDTAGCAAVGTYRDSSDAVQGLLLDWSAGTWSTAEAPLPGGAGASPEVTETSVSCSGAGSCAVVGDYQDVGYGRDLVVESQTPPCSAPAGAACAVTATLSVQLGTLSLESSPALYWEYDLNGYDQWSSGSASALSGCSVTVTGTACDRGSAPSLEVLDATGSGSGWALSAYLASADLPIGAVLDFGGAGSATIGVSEDDPLSIYPFALSTPATVCDYGSSCTTAAPASACSHVPLGFTSCPSYPVDIAAASGATGQVDLYSAAASSGVGAICFASGSPSAASCAGSTPSGYFNLGIPASAAVGTDGTTLLVVTVSSGP